MTEQSDIDTVALEVAFGIDDLFAQEQSGGEVQRTALVQCIIVRVIKAARQSAWNDGIKTAASECAMRGRAILLDAKKDGDPLEYERVVTAAFHFWRCAAHIEKLLSSTCSAVGEHHEA